MIFPAFILLILFSLVFLGLIIMGVVHLFHAWRFGEHTPLAAITSALFLLGIVLIIGGVVYFFREVDWRQNYEMALPFFNNQTNTESL